MVYTSDLLSPRSLLKIKNSVNTYIKKAWRLYQLLAPQLEALGIAHCSRNEQPKTPRRYERICPIVYVYRNKCMLT